MSLSKCQVELSNFEISKLIGKGSFGTVYKGKDLKSGDDVAIKIIFNDLSNKKDQETFMREATIPLKINCSAIVKHLGFRLPICDNESDEGDYNENDNPKKTRRPIIVTSYVPGGSLKQLNERYLNNEDLPNYGPTERAMIAFGIAYGMMVAHEHGIIHRDLTTANILIDKQGHPKIADFGCSRTTSASVDMTNMVGTPIFMAPEIVDSPNYGQSVDVYSFGIILYFLFTNELEMDDGKKVNSPFNLIRRVVNGARPKRPENMPELYWKLACECWKESPNDRPSFSKIVHFFLKSDEMALEERGKKTDLAKLHAYQQMLINEGTGIHENHEKHFFHTQPAPEKQYAHLVKSRLAKTMPIRKTTFNWKRH